MVSVKSYKNFSSINGLPGGTQDAVEISTNKQKLNKVFQYLKFEKEGEIDK